MSERSMDIQMEARLRTLYQVELERAASDLRAAPIARRSGGVARSGVLAAGFSAVAIAAVLLVVLALRPGSVTSPGAGALATSPTTAVATAGSTPSTTAGQGGIPATIDGRPVLMGAAITDAISKSTDDTPFLIGGWFPAGGYYGPFCAAQAPGPASCTPYLLHLSKGSQESLFVYPATYATDILSYMATQPVVMRVHTHDARCADLPNLDGCDKRPVLEEIVWLGPKS
jgi:hypothetical protein